MRLEVRDRPDSQGPVVSERGEGRREVGRTQARRAGRSRPAAW
jgi:hypothetical protein